MEDNLNYRKIWVRTILLIKFYSKTTTDCGLWITPAELLTTHNHDDLQSVWSIA